jgi:hypothetical protein
MAAAGGNAPLAPHMRSCAQHWRIEWMGNNPPRLGMYFGGVEGVYGPQMLLCSGNDKLPQHRSVLRTILTFNNPKNYIRLFGGLSPIHSTRRRGAKGFVWGTRGPFPPAAAMVSYGCDSWCWPFETYVRSTNCRNSKNCLRKYFFLFLRRSHTFLTFDPAAK